MIWRSSKLLNVTATRLIYFCKYHKHFDPKCISFVKIKSLMSAFMNEINNDKLRLQLKDLRFNGVEIKLCYYDSHLFDSKIVYNQSIISTVLLLPSTQHSIEDYHPLIDDLLQKNYRVIAMEFPGCGRSELIEQDPIYKSDLAHKINIVHDFLNVIIPNRKTELDCVIGFNDNSYVLPFLINRKFLFYMGHKSLIIVNPTPPNFVSKFIEEFKWLDRLDNFTLTKPIFKKMLINKMRTYNSLMKKETLYHLYKSWNKIDEQFIDYLSNNMSSQFQKTLILLSDNSKIYDMKFNQYFENYFGKLHNLKNINYIKSDEEKEIVNKQIFNMCSNFIYNKNKTS